MQKYLQLVFIIVSLLFSGLVHAGSNKEDKAFLAKTKKTGMKVQNKQLILNANQKSNESWVYVMQNTSSKAIYINHPAKNPGTASAGWLTVLDAKKWSALMLTRPDFNITCQYDFSKKPTSVVACGKILKISRFKPHLITAAKGDYWVGENQDLYHLRKTLSVRGVNYN